MNARGPEALSSAWFQLWPLQERRKTDSASAFRSEIAQKVKPARCQCTRLYPWCTTIAGAVIARSGRRYKDIDHVSAVSIDQRRDRAVVQVIEATADQRIAFRRKVLDGGATSTRPLNQGFTVCWSVDATSVR